ncbi:MAG: hypothetical protein PHW63_01545 [Alphaproteobacteria bacterium]|nr:hypothetical protein [Alphaproteobacteria bacterium]
MLHFDKAYWHTTGRDANCYIYAMNVRYNPVSLHLMEQFKRAAAEVSAEQMPGCLTGAIGFNATHDFVKYMGMDGCVFVNHTGLIVPAAPNNHYLVIALRGDKDSHFLRQDSDGLWSHKHGKSDISQLDDDSKMITNPLTCNLIHTIGTEKKYIGFFAVPFSGWTEAYPKWMSPEAREKLAKRFAPKSVRALG